MKIILDEEYTFFPNDDKTNLCVNFTVPQGYDALRCECSYSPKTVGDMELNRQAARANIGKYIQREMIEDNMPKNLSLVNLITFSLDFEDKYIGCAHRHAAKLVHIISKDGSSPGFMRQSAEAGAWRAVINIHSITSPKVKYSLKISAMTKADCEDGIYSRVASKAEQAFQEYFLSCEDDNEARRKIDRNDVLILERFDYKAFEMHTHTLHSDGTFTVEELCLAAKQKDFDAIALTDHNTIASYEELTLDLLEKSLPVVHGIEWTTFFGHMLVLGCDKYVDWRFATPDNIDGYLREIQRNNGVVGIAHPFSLGSPFCTGCYWHYNVRDWTLINYIEIWSEAFPQLSYKNIQALQWWTDLLNRGFHIAITQGRDWHGHSKKRENMSATYLGVKDGVINTETAKDALRSGRSYVTCGPGLSLEVEQNGQRAGLGKTIKPGQASVCFSIDSSLRKEHWDGFGIRPRTLRIVQNGAPVIEVPCGDTSAHALDVTLWPGWIRLEAIGDFMGQKDILLAVTSPIYVEY